METPEHFQRLSEIFEEARNLDPEGRETLLDAKCAVDSGLRREVETRFGGDCRFESCSASGMDFDELLQFLQQRRKIALLDGTVTVDPSKICDHD